MKIALSSILGTVWLSSRALAAPQNDLVRATSNPLEGFPALGGFEGRPGFMFVDPDGVYRAYLADGTVVDAARLTPEQIQTWVDARAPHLPAAVADNERTILASVNPQDVPEELLLNPPDNIKPHAEIEKWMAKYAVTPNPMEIVKRQTPINCPTIYCAYNSLSCSGYAYCYCNGAICVQ